MLRQQKLSVVVCVCLLGGHGLLSQNAISAELTVASSLATATLGSSFDSSLLFGYLNLDLDQKNTQKMILSNPKGSTQPTEWTLSLMAENSRSLPFILDNTLIGLDTRFEGNNVSMQDVLRWSKTNISLDESGTMLPNTFLRNVAGEEKTIAINLLPAPLVLPAIAQAPTQSNAPNFLSLVMLSIGGVVLLGWLRAKRQKSQVFSAYSKG